MSVRTGSVSVGSVDRREQIRLLYKTHMVDVYRHVHRRCRDVQIAEDVTQDVFVNVARSVEDPSTVTLAWLRRAATNRMIDVIRRAHNYESKLALVGETPKTTGEAELFALDQLVVEEALAVLSPLHRTVLMLHYVDGVATAELASMLERSPKGVEALITRARAAFRAAMEAQDG